MEPHNVGNAQSVYVQNAQGQAPFVLVCEHASRTIPVGYDLQISAEAARSHAAWDIGALAMAEALSAGLDAPLVAGGMSRLIYDLNRPLDAPDAIPARSEVFDIPGNADLPSAERERRHACIYKPFHNVLGDVIRAANPSGLVTLHSFTPVYNGKKRDTEIGFLHDADPSFAEAALTTELARGRYKCALNAPYGPQDGVLHTLERHGTANALPALMIEVRNDLIDTDEKAHAMAAHLHETLMMALAEVAA